MKIILFILLFVLVSCANTIPSINKIKNYSTEELHKILYGVKREEILNVWGEPDAMCSGMYCDIFISNDYSIAIYYDENDCVYDIPNATMDKKR